MDRSFGFINYHLASSSNENRNGLAALAILDDEHSLIGSAELHLPDSVSLTKLVLR